MAQKKSFINNDNPALRFISQTSEEQEKPAPIRTETLEAEAPDRYKTNPLYVEKKTARIQLVLKPTTAGELKHFCKSAGISVNDYVGGLIEKALDEQARIDEQDGQSLISEDYKRARAKERK